jgi:quercetin dioxygenase-like cupin family protein
MTRCEHITSCHGQLADSLASGVELTGLVGQFCNADELFTAVARFLPNAELQCHYHPCAEAIVVLEGVVHVTVENRRYELSHLDAIQIPAYVPHHVCNPQQTEGAKLLVALASDAPQRTFSPLSPAVIDCSRSTPTNPESVTRFATAPQYELGYRALFRDLFQGKNGFHGICGGFGEFGAGGELPCHTHDYDESITIIRGQAICQVAGAEYSLSDRATALVPRGRPHRFRNPSDEPMAMIWVYAGDTPDRLIVSQELCECSQNADRFVKASQGV